MWACLLFGSLIVLLLVVGLGAASYDIDGEAVGRGYFYVRAIMSVALWLALIVGAAVGLWMNASWSRPVMALFWPAQVVVGIGFGVILGQSPGEVALAVSRPVIIGALAFAYLYIAPEANNYYAELEWRERLQDTLDALRPAAATPSPASTSPA